MENPIGEVIIEQKTLLLYINGLSPIKFTLNPHAKDITFSFPGVVLGYFPGLPRPSLEAREGASSNNVKVMRSK